MKSRSNGWLALAFVVAAVGGVFGFSRLSAGDPPPAKTETAKTETAVADWQADPVCQMVFFAVLEGLYTDGVPSEAINALVPPQPADGKNNIKASFVFQCPLCHPVYEALRLYQKRPTFNADPKQRDTFGKGLSEEELKSLSSPNVSTRLKALAPVVQRYVQRRLDGMKLTPEQKAEWVKNLSARSAEGKTQLVGFMRANDPDYKGWSIYWGCAACNGVTDACRNVQP